MDFGTRDSEIIETKKRIGFAYLLATHPETFDLIDQNNIRLFHGTNSNALPNILKYGINSIDKLNEKGITPQTGEAWSRIQGKRSFISFTNDIDTAMYYTAMNSSNEGAKEDPFAVLIGMSPDSLKKLRRCHVQSALPEVGIVDTVPIENIEFIGVPENKVEFVRKMINDERIIVAPIEEPDKQFYYIDMDFGEISFDAEEAKQMAEEKKKTQTSIEEEEVKKLAEGRKISGIRAIYNKIREKIFSRRKENGTNSRDE